MNMNANAEKDIRSSASPVERVDVPTGLTYDALVTGFERELGRWEPGVVGILLESHAPWSKVEAEVARMAGAHGLMILVRIDQGAITSLSGRGKQCSLYLVGNPVIANQILDIDPRASLYVPFRVCLYDLGESGGAVLSFDRPSSSLGVLGRPELNEIGLALDQKLNGVIGVLVGKAAT